MPTQPNPTTRPIALTEDEIALVERYRALAIDPVEALRRLATPLSNPILPVGQELHANMPVTAESLTIPESRSDPRSAPP